MRLVVVWMIGLAACAGRIHDQGADVVTVVDRAAEPGADFGCGDPLRDGDTRGLRFVAWQPSCFPEREGEGSPAGDAEARVTPEAAEPRASGEAPAQTARR